MQLLVELVLHVLDCGESCAAGRGRLGCSRLQCLWVQHNVAYPTPAEGRRAELAGLREANRGQGAGGGGAILLEGQRLTISSADLVLRSKDCNQFSLVIQLLLKSFAATACLR